MGLVTTCSVAVDFDTMTVLFQSISTFCSGASWAIAIPQTAATVNTTKRPRTLKERMKNLVTRTPILRSTRTLDSLRCKWQTVLAYSQESFIIRTYLCANGSVLAPEYG